MDIRQHINQRYINLNAFLTTMGNSYRCPWCRNGKLDRDTDGLYKCPSCGSRGDVVTLAAVAWDTTEEDAMAELGRTLPPIQEEAPAIEDQPVTASITQVDKEVYIFDDLALDKQSELLTPGVGVLTVKDFGGNGLLTVLDKAEPGTLVHFRLEDSVIKDALIQKAREKQLTLDISTQGQLDLDAYMAMVGTERFKPIPTGIGALDDLIGGGFSPQTLITLGGSPGIGKTSFLTQVLEVMAMKGHECLYINLEMSKEQIIARSLSRLAYQKFDCPISQKRAMRGYDWNAEERDVMQRTADYYRKGIAVHFTYNPATIKAPEEAQVMEAIRAHCERCKAEGRPAPIIAIDYLQIITFPGTRDAVEGAKAFLTKLKYDIAVKYDAVIIVVVAHNRASNQRGIVTQESGRDTSAIEYSADIMLGLAFTAVEEGECSMDAIRLAIDGGEVKPPAGIEELTGASKDKAEGEYKRKKKELEVAKNRKNEVALKLLKGRAGEVGRAYFVFNGESTAFFPASERSGKSNDFDYSKEPPTDFEQINLKDLPDGWGGKK